MLLLVTWRRLRSGLHYSATGNDCDVGDVFVITVSPMPCPRSFMDLEADPLLHAFGWDRSGLHPIA